MGEGIARNGGSFPPVPTPGTFFLPPGWEACQDNENFSSKVAVIFVLERDLFGVLGAILT